MGTFLLELELEDLCEEDEEEELCLILGTGVEVLLAAIGSSLFSTVRPIEGVDFASATTFPLI